MTMCPGLNRLRRESQAPTRSHANVGCGWSVHSGGRFHFARAVFLLPVANGTLPAAASSRADVHAPGAPLPPIPEPVQRSHHAARRSWLDRCLDAPLVDPATNSRVHVYGNVHFAPFGGARGLEELQELLDRIQPTVLAIEQPYDLGARAGLPYPELIHTLADLPRGDVLRLAGPEPRDSSGLAGGAGTASEHLQSQMPLAAAATAGGGGGGGGGGMQGQVERLQSLLPGLAQPARVGRDLLDPFEVFGLYGGCDYVTRPEQLVEALSLFGHLPGLEYAALVAAAQQRGVQVCSVDAPLRLQERWAAQLVADFSLTESDLARRLQRDLARAQSLLPAEYLDWDVALAEALWAVSSSGSSGSSGSAAEEPSLRTVTAFKVSRAVAAATVPYEASKEAFALQAALQPLKFAFFARRARHLVLQIRDVCQRMSVRRVRVDADSFRSTELMGGSSSSSSKTHDVGAGGSARGQAAAVPEQQRAAALVDVSDQPEKVVLAVIGRQYVSYIRELWTNERSVLWQGDVPRTFAPSALERP